MSEFLLAASCFIIGVLLGICLVGRSLEGEKLIGRCMQACLPNAYEVQNNECWCVQDGTKTKMELKK